MTHQTLSLEKYWKLFPATLSIDQSIDGGYQSTLYPAILHSP